MTKPTGKPVGRPRKDAVQTRDDGPYMNVISALGSSRDSTGYTKASPVRYFSELELTDLYIGDGFARRIVDVTATDMTRSGFCIEVEGEDESEEESAFAPVMVRLEELHANERLTDALKLEAIFGGAMIVMGVKDGGELLDPLNDRAVQDIEFLRVYDRYHVSRMERYTDPADVRYGQTKTYLVSPSNATPYTVHESRCLIFPGEFVPESMRDLQDGWGVSALAKCWYQLQRLGVSHQWAEKLLEKSQQAVAKFSGLSQQLMAPGGEQAVINRLNMLDLSRNTLNSIAIDSTDEYTITSNSFAGVPDLLDRFAQALSAVTGMPKTLLMGEQAKGLNNSQSGDLQNWYACIEQKQRTQLLQPIDRLVTLLATAKKIQNQDYLIEFEGLDIPDEKTEAETEKLEAEKDKIKADTAAVYVTAGALDPSELRQTLIDEGKYIMDASIQIMQAEDDGEVV